MNIYKIYIYSGILIYSPICIYSTVSIFIHHHKDVNLYLYKNKCDEYDKFIKSYSKFFKYEYSCVYNKQQNKYYRYSHKLKSN